MISTKELARRWGTSIPIAENTRKTTIQRGVRELTNSLGRRFRTRQHQLQSRVHTTKFYSDTLFSSKTSALGNSCAQLFVTAKGYADGNVMKTKGDTPTVLNKLCKEVGIPQVFVANGAKKEYH